MDNIQKIIFYTTPAHGHINPTLPVLSRLADEGYTVIAYSTEEFREIIEKSGALFRAYETGDIVFDTSIGSEILPLTKLILRFTEYSLPSLINEARNYSPVLIMHDTLALWGRVTGNTLNIPAVSINSIQTIYSIKSNTFKIYCHNFVGSTLTQIRHLNKIFKLRKEIDCNYLLGEKDIISILMNREKLNIFTYPRCMHPDGDKLGNDCFFVGSTSGLRQNKKGFVTDKDNIIYVSLGTVFNRSLSFYKKLITEFSGKEYELLVACGNNYGRLKSINFPDNITLTPYADQSYALRHAVLFITAGGMNSLCEAVSSGVPCLMVPQQGEQYANSVMVQRIGAGIISKGKFYDESKRLINNFRKNDDIINAFSSVQLDNLMNVLEDYMKG